jgi:hypothetical protein
MVFFTDFGGEDANSARVIGNPNHRYAFLDRFYQRVNH